MVATQIASVGSCFALDRAMKRSNGTWASITGLSAFSALRFSCRTWKGASGPGKYRGAGSLGLAFKSMYSCL
jgi:hypothetical protein